MKVEPTTMRILVTGAAGLIGRELCGVLAERGHGVVALTRRSSALGRNSRILARNDGTPVATRPWAGVMPGRGEITLLDGDVADEGLGLASETTGTLTGALDLVVHCAALTAFNLDPDRYTRVNTGGARQALALALQGGIPLLHVSTAYVCGDRGGAIAEARSDAERFTNGYEASKAAAEALVLAAGELGHPVAIARPSIVVGASGDGAIGAFGNLYQLIRLVTEGRVGALPATADASLDLVPIDHVVGGLVDIAERMAAAAGQVFHLASGVPTSLAGFGRLARGFPHLRPPRFVRPELFDAGSMTARQRQLHGQVVELYASYLRPSPRFVTANLQALSGRVCPPVDTAFLGRLIGYAIAAGFLATPAQPDAAA